MHEVLVNRLGGLSLPKKSVVRLTDRPDMTLDVYRGRKITIQLQVLKGIHNLFIYINLQKILKGANSFRSKFKSHKGANSFRSKFFPFKIGKPQFQIHKTLECCKHDVNNGIYNKYCLIHNT